MEDNRRTADTQQNRGAVTPSGENRVSVGTRGTASASPRRVPDRRVPQRRVSGRHAVRDPRFITIRKKERTPFPIITILFLIALTVLFLFMIMNYAEIDKYNSSVTGLQNELAKLQQEQKKLENRLENKDDRAAFEKYASEELGMVKSNTLYRYYIALNPKDKTEIVEREEKTESGFGFLLSGIAEVLRDFWSRTPA